VKEASPRRGEIGITGEERTSPTFELVLSSRPNEDYSSSPPLDLHQAVLQTLRNNRMFGDGPYSKVNRIIQS